MVPCVGDLFTSPYLFVMTLMWLGTSFILFGSMTQVMVTFTEQCVTIPSTVCLSLSLPRSLPPHRLRSLPQSGHVVGGGALPAPPDGVPPTSAPAQRPLGHPRPGLLPPPAPPLHEHELHCLLSQVCVDMNLDAMHAMVVQRSSFNAGIYACL